MMRHLTEDLLSARIWTRLRTGEFAEAGFVVTAALAVIVTAVFYAVAVFPFRYTYFGQLLAGRGSIPYLITALSAWALVMIAAKYSGLHRQRRALASDPMSIVSPGAITPAVARELISRLERLSPGVARTTLLDRLLHGLRSFAAHRHVATVVEQVNLRAQADAGTIDRSHSMIRVLIWAIPILGFMGTVLGISTAVNSFSISAADAADIGQIKTAIDSVTAGLAVAFDTTLLGLVMSMIVMFPSTAIQKAEEKLLAAVEDYTDRHLVSRLREDKAGIAPDTSEGRTATEDLIRRTIAEEMARHHAELEMWSTKLDGVGRIMRDQAVSAWAQITRDLSARPQHFIEQLTEWGVAHQQRISEETEKLHRRLISDVTTSMNNMAKSAEHLHTQFGKQAEERLAHLAGFVERIEAVETASVAAQDTQLSTLKTAADVISESFVRLANGVAGTESAVVSHLETVATHFRSHAAAVENALNEQRATHQHLAESTRALAKTVEAAGEGAASLSQTLTAVVPEVWAQIARLSRGVEEFRRSRQVSQGGNGACQPQIERA